MELVNFIIYLFILIKATSGSKGEGHLDFFVFTTKCTLFVMFDSSIYISCQIWAGGMIHKYISG